MHISHLNFKKYHETQRSAQNKLSAQNVEKYSTQDALAMGYSPSDIVSCNVNRLKSQSLHLQQTQLNILEEDLRHQVNAFERINQVFQNALNDAIKTTTSGMSAENEDTIFKSHLLHAEDLMVQILNERSNASDHFIFGGSAMPIQLVDVKNEHYIDENQQNPQNLTAYYQGSNEQRVFALGNERISVGVLANHSCFQMFFDAMHQVKYFQTKTEQSSDDKYHGLISEHVHDIKAKIGEAFACFSKEVLGKVDMSLEHIEKNLKVQIEEKILTCENANELISETTAKEMEGLQEHHVILSDLQNFLKMLERQKKSLEVIRQFS